MRWTKIGMHSWGMLIIVSLTETSISRRSNTHLYMCSRLTWCCLSVGLPAMLIWKLVSIHTSALFWWFNHRWQLNGLSNGVRGLILGNLADMSLSLYNNLPGVNRMMREKTLLVIRRRWRSTLINVLRYARHYIHLCSILNKEILMSHLYYCFRTY